MATGDGSPSVTRHSSETDAVTERIADGVFVADTAGRFIDVNQAACESLRYTREELLSLGISHLTAQKHVSNILAKMEAASRTEAAARALREGLLD